MTMPAIPGGRAPHPPSWRSEIRGVQGQLAELSRKGVPVPIGLVGGYLLSGSNLAAPVGTSTAYTDLGSRMTTSQISFAANHLYRIKLTLGLNSSIARSILFQVNYGSALGPVITGSSATYGAKPLVSSQDDWADFTWFGLVASDTTGALYTSIKPTTAGGALTFYGASNTTLTVEDLGLTGSALNIT